MTPTEKHCETAKDIAFDFDCDWTADGRRRGDAEYHAAIDAIAAALAKAEREGMESERKRCAEIASEQHKLWVSVVDNRVECGMDATVQAAQAAEAEYIADSILSQAGEA